MNDFFIGKWQYFCQVDNYFYTESIRPILYPFSFLFSSSFAVVAGVVTLSMYYQVQKLLNLMVKVSLVGVLEGYLHTNSSSFWYGVGNTLF